MPKVLVAALLGLASAAPAAVQVVFNSHRIHNLGSEPISLGNVADAVCRGVGVEPVHNNYIPPFVHGDIFAPSSNFLFTVIAPKTETLSGIFSSATTVTPVGSLEDSLSQFYELVTGSASFEDKLNLNDRLSQAFGGESLTISLAGSALYAEAARADGSNDYAFISGKDGNLYPLTGSNDIRMDPREDVVSVVSGLARAGRRISTPNPSFSFDLTQPVQQAFFNELQNIFRLLVSLGDSNHALHARVTDGVPDSFSYVVTSLADLAEQYSLQSPEYTHAAQVVQQIMPVFVTLSRRAYPTALVELVRIEHASAPEATAGRHLLQAQEPSAADGPTPEDVTRYQIVLWFSIGWAVVLYFVSMSICNMSNKKDTLSADYSYGTNLK